MASFSLKAESKAITKTTKHYMICPLLQLSVLTAHQLSPIYPIPATLASLFLRPSKRVLPQGLVLAMASPWNVLPLGIFLVCQEER